VCVRDEVLLAKIRESSWFLVCCVSLSAVESKVFRGGLRLVFITVRCPSVGKSLRSGVIIRQIINVSFVLREKSSYVVFICFC